MKLLLTVTVTVAETFCCTGGWECKVVLMPVEDDINVMKAALENMCMVMQLLSSKSMHCIHSHVTEIIMANMMFHSHGISLLLSSFWCQQSASP